MNLGAIFFTLAGVATVTKKDFSFMGKFLFIGMIVALCGQHLLHDSVFVADDLCARRDDLLGLHPLRHQ